MKTFKDERKIRAFVNIRPTHNFKQKGNEKRILEYQERKKTEEGTKICILRRDSLYEFYKSYLMNTIHQEDYTIICYPRQ